MVWTFTLLANVAAAQSTTEDGIRAMLRGDEKVAARILRPLADDAARPDPVAQFFLALVFEADREIGDSGRACRLFLRASMQANPFAQQAAALATAIRNESGGGADLMCIADEGWQGGPAQSFVLGPEHRIVFADTSITVTHGNHERRTPVIVPPGAALQIKYTPLDVTQPMVARRHFFQWFGWRPDTTANTSSWMLSWSLIEVVGDRWIPITGERTLAVMNGPTRPGSDAVTGLVRVRVNASGEAEYAITAGDAARTAVIPLQGSR